MKAFQYARDTRGSQDTALALKELVKQNPFMANYIQDFGKQRFSVTWNFHSEHERALIAYAFQYVDHDQVDSVLGSKARGIPIDLKNRLQSMNQVDGVRSGELTLTLVDLYYIILVAQLIVTSLRPGQTVKCEKMLRAFKEEFYMPLEGMLPL